MTYMLLQIVAKLNLFQIENKFRMDLSSAKVTPEQKVSLCTKYFYLGFLCLPFLWGVNAAWFFGEAFRSKHFFFKRKIVTSYAN